jgi:hypothetical protein
MSAEQNFDGSLGFQPSFAVGRLVYSIRPLYRFEAMVYDSLGFWFAFVYAVHAWYNVRYRLSLLKLFIANAFVGFSLYFLLPAMGPKYAFHSFPALPGPVHSAAALSGRPECHAALHFGVPS